MKRILGLQTMREIGSERMGLDALEARSTCSYLSCGPCSTHSDVACGPPPPAALP